MARKGSAFAGLWVAISTPLKDGQLDEAKLKEQVEFQIAAGTHGLCPVGTTGESPTLSHDEHERVISIVVQTARGRCKVMPGTGSNSTAEALRLTKWAAKEGADAALMVAPYYNKPTQEGFYQHYKAVAEQVGIPICVYNIPGRTGKNIEPETFVRFAELPNITLVKEATGSLDQASQILSATDLTILSGDDSLTLPLLSVGGEGVISVVGNIVPKDMIALLNAYFGCLAGAVLDQGGEVLKFIGDGLLAVFPFASFATEQAAAQAALAAAEQACADLKRLNAAPPAEIAAIEGWHPLRTGIALHDGEVFFGNVGASARLDFTVIGRAILITETVAARLDRPLDDLGRHPLRGVVQPVAIFSSRPA